MAAVGNYEVVFAEFGPFEQVHTDYFESIPAPGGKVVLGGGFTDMESTTFGYTHVYPSTDGKELIVRIRPQSTYKTFGAWATFAEMG